MTTPPRARAARLLATAALAVLPSPRAVAAGWDVFPPATLTNDFGGVGLLQTPTGRFAEDGQVTAGGNHVSPYDRYFVTIQPTPWLEATLRYSSVGNRLYSPFPTFSGDQSYKDRGFDIKLKIADETRLTPALAAGLRDFIGTGLFSSEYFVATKEIGPVDATLGMAFGNLGSRGLFRNPFTLISDRFRDRGQSTAGGGTTNGSYFKGKKVALFGGIQYETPLRGLTFRLEYDSNSYHEEALGNRFRVSAPVNFGLDYKVTPWLQLGAGFERGNRLAVRFALTGNVAHRSNIPKFDPPAPPMRPVDPVATPSVSPSVFSLTALPPAVPAGEAPDELAKRLAIAIGMQGSGLYATHFDGARVDIYVAQARFRNVATGLGRVARAAFSVLPGRYQAVRVIFVEGGMETAAATIYRSMLIEALTPGRGSTDSLWMGSTLEAPPLRLEEAEFQGPANSTKPHLFYSVRPGLRTTIGRPERFILYQALVRLNLALQIRRGLSVSGALAASVSDNFDKLVQPSDSLLPHVRSDIKEYLRQGNYTVPFLQAEQSFTIAPGLYGHVYGGLLEEMFAGVGGEVLYRPFGSNLALGADLTYVRQRDFDQIFDLRNYRTLTGFGTIAYHLPGSEIDVVLRAGRYLAKDYGATLDISRTFPTGVKVGAFATKTNVSAAQFGEGRFDKGFYVTIPLDLIYIKNVRTGIGLLYRPLIRDGGQQLNIRNTLLATTDATTRYNFARDWRDILK